MNLKESIQGKPVQVRLKRLGQSSEGGPAMERTIKLKPEWSSLSQKELRSSKSNKSRIRRSNQAMNCSNPRLSMLDILDEDEE